MGCDRLPREAHGKEGVDGSSPSEGSAKSVQIAAFFLPLYLHEFQYAVGMEPFMELPEIEPTPFRSETRPIANGTH